MFKSTKRFGPISTSHRNWMAKLNENRDSKKCSYIHGYSRYIEFTFVGELDNCSWVMDFGNLKDVKNLIEEIWDHAVLVSSNDPELDLLKELHEKELIKLSVIDISNNWGPGIEGSCIHMFDLVSKILIEKTGGRVGISKIQIWEHENNSAIFEPSLNDYNRHEYSDYQIRTFKGE